MGRKFTLEIEFDPEAFGRRTGRGEIMDAIHYALHQVAASRGFKRNGDGAYDELDWEFDSQSHAVYGGVIEEPAAHVPWPTDAFDGESDLVRMIKQRLMDDELWARLAREKCSIEDLLNGRLEGRGRGHVYEYFFDHWNLKIGRKEFGFDR